SPFDLVAYSDSDYAGASLDKKSTTGGCQFLRCKLISWQCKKQTVVATSSTEAEYVAADSCCGQAKHIEYLMLKTSPLKHVKRGQDTKIPQSSGPPVKVGDEAVHKELGDRMERAATTASSLEAEQDSDAQTWFEAASKQSNDPPLLRVNTLGSGEDNMKLIELMAHYTTLSDLFWGTATARTTNDGEVEITASIDGQVKTITEASLRRHLKWKTLMTYFSKGTLFSSVEVFHSYNPSMTFNFSKMIFDAMVKNLDSTHKFLMYPRFLQICLNKQKRLLQPHIRTYLAHTLTKKLFSNMKRALRGYFGVYFPLFPTMITTPESSPSRITSSPSLSPQTYQSPQSSPLRDITRQDAEIPHSQFPTQTQVTNEAAFINVDVDAGGVATTDIGLEAGQGSGTMHKTPTRPHDLPLSRVHTLGSDKGSLQQNELMDLVTKLTDRVEVLENDMQQTKKDEDAEEDSSKQGRKISEIDKDPTILLVQPEQDMEYDFDVSTAEGFTTASVLVTTASASISTANPIKVSTAKDISGAETLVYIRRSASKDKGKGIMTESEPEQITTKLQQRQERVGFKAAIRLQEQFDEEERQREEVVAKVNQDHDIDWSDPANQGGYKQSHFKGMSYEDIRPIFERVWDQNHAFVSKDSEIEKEIVQQEDVVAEQVVIESSKKARGRLKKKVSKDRKDKDKRQKMQDDPEKLTLKEYVEVISNSEEVISVIPLAVKSLIVSWKSYCKGDVGYYEIHRADGSYKTYTFFSKMLNDFDREDLILLYRLLNEKYASTRPGFLMTNDLGRSNRIMLIPDSDDEVWKNHQSQELIKWKLYDSCGVHPLMLGEVSIHMLVEKKYPLPQDTLTRMLQMETSCD
ncbi:hypothetical protein Tco_0829395, partial [Tanacetum coccineum]